MANSPETTSMALFCDFENVAIGVRDAKYDRFDIKRVLERLLLKGSIVVKKAYCDWDRYKPFKAAMHEASFELIEIPHVRQSGKNSADIRMVVDALDLCYTKSHVNTFVIISGDSDFSPLVSKLRENAKQVIGVGVKHSTSDLLVANCDEFIFYDDLVREGQRALAKRNPQEAPTPAPKRTPEEERRRREESEARKRKAIDMAVETFEALVAERGDSGRIWPSMVKQALKRRRPDFSESYFGFRSFGALLEEAQGRGLLDLGRDEKGNVHVQRTSGSGPGAGAGSRHAEPAGRTPEPLHGMAGPDEPPPFERQGEPAPADEGASHERGDSGEPNAPNEPRRRGRGGRKPAAKTVTAAVAAAVAPAAPNMAADTPAPTVAEVRTSEALPVEYAAPRAEPAAPVAPEGKPAARKRSPRARRPAEPAGRGETS